ncbi:hypothetical protein [Prosthecobacter sp.]|uniref:hypothetical protein n=1 Tax=Prosthecobacter sp. TaxID=1965333 RepID=UPI003784E04B
MNNLISLLIAGVMGISLTLGFIVALRAKRQFGFLAPLGFMVSALLQMIVRAAMLPLFSQDAARLSHESVRDITSKLSADDAIFYLSLGGHANGIWHLGAIAFLICGLIDLRAAGGASTGKLRYPLIILGILLMMISVFYPSLMVVRWW